METAIITLVSVVISIALLYSNGIFDDDDGGAAERRRREHWFWKRFR